MTVETMAQGGGLVAVVAGGQPFLACPVTGCPARWPVTDLGEFVDTGLTEESVRTHLATHGVADWMRTVAVERRKAAMWEASTTDLTRQLRERPRRCCAVQAISEVANALQETMGDPCPDAAWTDEQAEAHLAAAEADHDR